MNKLIIFAAGVIAGSVIPLATQVYLLNDECAYLKMDLEATKNELEDAKKKLNYPCYKKHGRGPAVKKEKPSVPIGFC